MALRKSVEEVLVVTGERAEVFQRCQRSLTSSGFSAIEANPTLYQLTAKFRKLTTWGEILVTLIPEGTNTRLTLKATANVDNIYALFSSPTKKVLTAFKTGFGS
jgi:hypothetical protein